MHRPPGAGEETCQDTASRPFPLQQAEQPLQPHCPSKPARTQSLVAASIGKLIFSSLPACLKGVSLPQQRANALTSQVQNNKKHFPKLAEMGLYTFQIFVAFWFGDDLRNKADDVFWGRFCLTGNIRAIVFPTLEWPLKYHFHRKWNDAHTVKQTWKEGPLVQTRPS